MSLTLKETELELRIPIDELEDIAEMYEVETPKNFYRGVEDAIIAEETVEEFVKDSVTGILEESVEEPVEETAEIVSGREDAIIIVPDVDEDYTDKTGEHLETFDEKVSIISGYEPNIIGVERVTELEQIAEIANVPKLPSNKADYMRMSVAEKVRRYGFDAKGTNKAIDMVKVYFQSVGMDAEFDDVYEEAKLLTDYCAKEVVEHQISAKVQQITKGIDICNIELNQLSKYPADLLAMVFDFSDVDYYTGIKLFNTVLNRKGACLDHQERYELFEKIYAEGMREKQWENSRCGRR